MFHDRGYLHGWVSMGGRRVWVSHDRGYLVARRRRCAKEREIHHRGPTRINQRAASTSSSYSPNRRKGDEVLICVCVRANTRVCMRVSMRSFWTVDPSGRYSWYSWVVQLGCAMGGTMGWYEGWYKRWYGGGVGTDLLIRSLLSRSAVTTCLPCPQSAY